MSITQRLKQYININNLIVAYAFVLPLSKAATTGVELLLILLWLFEGKLQSKFIELRSNTFFILLVSFLSLSLVSFFWSSDTSYYLDYMRKYWHFLVIPIILTSLSIKYIKNIFSAFLLGMFISEVVSYGIFFELWTKEGVSASDPSPFMDHTNYSIYLAFTVFILMHRIFYEPSVKWKLVYGIYMIISMSNLFINGGRTGQVAFFIALILVAVINIQHKVKALVYSLLSIVVIFVLAYNISPTFNKRMNYTYNETKNMIQKSDFSGAMSMRISLWIMGSHVFLDNPLVGTGIGDEALNLETYVEKYDFSTYENFKGNYIDYHNAFIQYAVQLGILGLVLVVSLFISLYKLKFKSILYRNLHITFVSLFIMLSMIGLSLHIMASMLLFVLFASVFSVISKYETTQNVALFPSCK